MKLIVYGTRSRACSLPPGMSPSYCGHPVVPHQHVATHSGGPLKVEDSSPLASRTFRNHFEHFDKRLETWGISTQTHRVVDSNIGSLGSIRGGLSCVFVRNFDPSTQTLTFHGDMYELRPVIEALESLRARTMQVLERNLPNQMLHLTAAASGAFMVQRLTCRSGW